MTLYILIFGLSIAFLICLGYERDRVRDYLFTPFYYKHHKRFWATQHKFWGMWGILFISVIFSWLSNKSATVHCISFYNQKARDFSIVSPTWSNKMNIYLIMEITNLKPRHYWTLKLILTYDFSVFLLWAVTFPGCQRIRVSVFYMIISTPDSCINHLTFDCDRDCQNEDPWVISW